MTSLTKRLIVASWGIPLLAGLIWLDGWWTAALIAGVSFIGQVEYYKLQEAQGRKPIAAIGIFAGLVVVALWQIGGMEAIGWTIAALFLALALLGLLTGNSHADLMATFNGVIYPTLLLGSFLMVRNSIATGAEGLQVVFGLLGAIWTCDTAAYGFGRWTGKHLLAPKISPGKTVEGFAWGLIWASLFAIVWWWYGFVDADIAIVIAFSAGLIGQLGDLVESALKREAGVKDSGTFLPGHGGALDRFDSLIAAAPVLAMYLGIRTQLFALLSRI